MTDTRTFHEKLNSRKLWLTVGVVGLATALLVGEFITGDNWVMVVQMTAGAYIIAQAWQDRSN